MGLFGSILSGMGGLLGSIIGAEDNADAVEKASETQTEYMQKAIDEIARQYDTSRGDYMPWIESGKEGLAGLEDLLGLNGPNAAAAAIEALRRSPMFQSLYRTGEESVLQNASATGGLRGGNTQRSLYELGEDTLSRVIEAQLARLGALSGSGANMTSSLGTLGANKAGQIGQSLTGMGQVSAGGILGKQQVYNNLSNQISSILSSVMGGMGGF